MNKISYLFSQVLEGKTATRAMMHHALKGIVVEGKVVDVGGAREPEYVKLLDTKLMSSFSIIDGMIQAIDFEKDRLPFPDREIDTVLLCNVLEHIYHHQWLVSEIYRCIADGGKLIGFVPFLVQYHPDPKDYFRYTNEALHKIFSEAGFSQVEIRPVGLGPFIVSFNTIAISIPHLVSAPLFVIAYTLDTILIKFKPSFQKRFPIGYIFICKKNAA